MPTTASLVIHKTAIALGSLDAAAVVAVTRCAGLMIKWSDGRSIQKVVTSWIWLETDHYKVINYRIILLLVESTQYYVSECDSYFFAAIAPKHLRSKCGTEWITCQHDCVFFTLLRLMLLLLLLTMRYATRVQERGDGRMGRSSERYTTSATGPTSRATVRATTTTTVNKARRCGGGGGDAAAFRKYSM